MDEAVCPLLAGVVISSVELGLSDSEEGTWVDWVSRLSTVQDLHDSPARDEGDSQGAFVDVPSPPSDKHDSSLFPPTFTF